MRLRRPLLGLLALTGAILAGLPAAAAGLGDLFARPPTSIPTFAGSLASAGRDPRAIDHAAWQQWLNRYLDARHPSGIHRVRYAQVDARGRAALTRYIDTLAVIDPRPYARAEQMAYWINLYNALTVRVVLDHPGIDSIRDVRSGIFSAGPWKLPLVRVAGTPLSLDDIEHGILRPVFADRRVHYAVNCASLGCPNLAAEAYSGARLDAQLEAAERSYLAHPRGLHFEGRTLVLSSIFDWYGRDFAPDKAGLLAYLAARAPAALAPRVRTSAGQVRYAYDWALNRP